MEISKIILKGETGHKSTSAEVSESTVVCEHQTVHKSLPEGARFQLRWAINLANLSEAQIMEAAAEYYVIKIRRVFAKIDKPKTEEWQDATFDAKDFVTIRVSAKDRLAKSLATFSDEELAGLGLTRS